MSTLFERLQKFNPNHKPAGGPDGGQFTTGSGGSAASSGTATPGKRNKRSGMLVEDVKEGEEYHHKSLGRVQVKVVGTGSGRVGVQLAGRVPAHGVFMSLEQRLASYEMVDAKDLSPLSAKGVGPYKVKPAGPGVRGIEYTNPRGKRKMSQGQANRLFDRLNGPKKTQGK